jgi:Family of unknown function (DUF5317)
VKLVLAFLLIACGLGYARGGRLRGLVEARLRAPWLVVVGLALQVAPLPRSLAWLAVPLLLLSFVLLMEFTVLNLNAPGFVLILIGVLLNFGVISANHGMPVSRASLVSSGQMDTLDTLVANGGAKHHLAGPHDVLLPLADEISLGSTVHQVVSLGDVATYGGVMWFVAGAMIRTRSESRGRPRELVAQGAA